MAFSGINHLARIIIRTRRTACNSYNYSNSDKFSLSSFDVDDGAAQYTKTFLFSYMDCLSHRRSVRFMSPLSRKWRSGGGGRALSPDVSASLAMSICHVLIIVLFCDLIAYQDGVRSLVSTTTFADRNLHVYIKPSENRSIGGRGGGDARKSLHRTTIAPLEGVKGGEGGGMCALNEPCASFSIFLCCNAQRLCIEQFPGTCPTNAKFHFCIFLYSWGWD
ncbi:hypothetical protein DFH94DRAFT_711928 [Russula ochroleuca]|uniref:Uncharacterized protein n=1 Tax=Russula ochroleuca TaxID=152965 RepID=A0A9P5N4Y5_9AGAM|nr:hypothetical protein DFH94DRAFT_711928 [Russula ochroleuca]